MEIVLHEAHRSQHQYPAQRVGGKNAEKRIEAERFFSENKAEILPQLLDELENRVAKTNQQVLKPIKALGYFALFNIPFCLYCWYAMNSDAEYAMFAAVGFLLPALWLVVMIWALRFCDPKQEERTLIRLIEKIDDPRFVGFLIDKMLSNNLPLQTIVRPVLYRQLLLLRPSHASLLSTRHCAYLRHRLLRFGTDKDYDFNEARTLTVLQAFEQSDCKQALLEVREIAKKAQRRRSEMRRRIVWSLSNTARNQR